MQGDTPKSYSRGYENGIIWLPELAREFGGIVRDISFLRCQINGPAVVLVSDTTEYVGSFTYLSPVADLIREFPDSAFWLMPEDQRLSLGALLFEHCRFEDCTFEGVAWAGNETQRQWWRDSVSLGRWAQEMDE